MEKKGVLSDLVCEASVTLIPKREKALETKEERKRERRAEGGRKERRKEGGQLQTNIPHEHRCKIYNKILAGKIWQCIKRTIRHNLWDLSQECKALLTFENQCNSWKKTQNIMLSRKKVDKISTTIHDRNSQQIRTGRELLNLKRAISDKSRDNIIFNSE